LVGLNFRSMWIPLSMGKQLMIVLISAAIGLYH
jgi:hypothetical protein